MLRQPLLTAALALGLLAGCSNRNVTESRLAESGGTPPTPMETPPHNKSATEAPTDGTAAAPPESESAVFFVKDSGIRCMVAPCPSLVATRPDRPGEEGLKVTDIDLSALNLPEDQRARVQQALYGPGLKVEATVETVPHAGPAGPGTVLRVTRLVEGK